MQSNTVHEQIKKFIRTHFPSARNRNIRNDDRLLENGVLDSLGVLDLVNYIEEEFKITIVDEDLVPEHFQTIEHLAVFVREKSVSAPR
jgi:acyl carrier protein